MPKLALHAVGESVQIGQTLPPIRPRTATAFLDRGPVRRRAWPQGPPVIATLAPPRFHQQLRQREPHAGPAARDHRILVAVEHPPSSPPGELAAVDTEDLSG